MTLNRLALVTRIAEREGVPAVLVDQMLGALMTEIGESLAAGEPVALRSFGKFEPRTRKPVVRLNPATGVPISVPETRSVGFLPSKNLKQRLNDDSPAPAA